MNILDDGSVIPSNFSMNKEPGFNNSKHLYDNVSLRSGVIQRLIYPNDPNSVTKKVLEYDIRCMQQDVGNGANFIVYRNARFNNFFGSNQDGVNYTLVPGVETKGILLGGSQVLFLCINGQATSGATIIGALPNLNTVNKIPSSNDGKFYDFMFNGININVNDDGELTIEYNSPIDTDGKKASEQTAGTKIKLDKTGGLKISDNENQSWELDRANKKTVWTNGSESVTIDKAAKSISVISGGEYSEKSKTDSNIEAGGNVSVKAKADIKMSSDANAKLEAKGNLDLKTSGNWTVSAQGNSQITTAGNLTMTSQGVAQMKGTINLIGEGTFPAAIVGVSICIGIGNLGGAVVSTIITGSSTVYLGA